MSKIILLNRQVASGRFFWQVVDRRGHVIREARDWTPNLILNAGLDRVNNAIWPENWKYAGVGTDATANTVDSGVTTASQSGTTVTLVGGSFTFAAGDATGGGNVIAWDSGERARITGYTGPTQVTVAESQTVGAGQFTLAKTNQTGLGAAVKWDNAYLTGAGNCGTARSGNVLTHRRTWDFTYEVSTNWARNNTSVFSRLLLPPGGVYVDTGQQIRIIYELQIALGPITPVSYPGGTVVGWGSGTFDFQLSWVGMGGVATTGASATFGIDNGYTLNEPAGFFSQAIWAGDQSAALPTWPGAGPGYGTAYTTAASFTMDTYTNYTFYRGRTGLFTTGEANHNVRTIGVGTGYPGFGAQYTYTGVLARFDANQVKDSEHTLTIKYGVSWSRNIIV
jgi:hypothetical protein